MTSWGRGQKFQNYCRYVTFLFFDLNVRLFFTTTWEAFFAKKYQFFLWLFVFIGDFIKDFTKYFNKDFTKGFPIGFY